MELSKARNIANRIVEILKPHCVKIHIAGSIRREKPEVKDIEIVCEPFKQNIGSSLFGEEMFGVSRSFKVAAATFIDKVESGTFEGRYLKIRLLNTDILLDLFMPQSSDYYRQLAIRTGSSEFSQHTIAAGWLKKGWCGVKELGLRKITDCEDISHPEERKSEWRLVNPDPELPPEWKSEEEFFKWIGIHWIEPKNRI